MKGANKFWIIAVVLLLLINVAMLIYMMKGKRRVGKKQAGKAPFEMMVKELNMTDQQQADYKKMKEAHFTAIRPVFDSIRSVKKSLFNLVKADAVSDSLISQQSALIAEQQAIADKATIEHFRKVRALFSGDQQQKFDEFIQKMMQRRKGGGPGGKGDSADRKPE